jgi:hypothetical protein
MTQPKSPWPHWRLQRHFSNGEAFKMAGKKNLFTPALLDINAAAEVACGRSAAPIVPQPQQSERKVIEEPKAETKKQGADYIEPPANAKESSYVVVRRRDDDWATIFWSMDNEVKFETKDRRVVFMDSGVLQDVLVSALRLRCSGAQIHFAKVNAKPEQLVDKLDWEQVEPFAFVD